MLQFPGWRVKKLGPRLKLKAEAELSERTLERTHVTSAAVTRVFCLGISDLGTAALGLVARRYYSTVLGALES